MVKGLVQYVPNKQIADDRRPIRAGVRLLGGRQPAHRLVWVGQGMYGDLPVTSRLEITEFAPYSPRLSCQQADGLQNEGFQRKLRSGVSALKSEESAYHIS